MYSMQPEREETVIADRLPTRRSLHALPANGPELGGTQVATRRALHSSVRESARAIPQPIAPSAQPAARPVHTAPKHDQTQLFDIATFGPLSPESAKLTSSRATGPLNFREPTIAELMWMEEMRSHLKLPTAPRLTAQELGKEYDAYCTAWHGHSRRNKWDHFYVATSVGIGIGDLLVENSEDCSWVVLEDGGNVTYAVRDAARRATYFPIDAVNRRWVAGKLEWIPDFVTNALKAF